MKWFRRFIARPWWTLLKLHASTLLGKPYFKVFVFQTDEIGNVGIDAHYNIHFIYDLDRAYRAANSDHYDENLDDQAKVAIYLYDTFGNIAENYMPMEQVTLGEDDIGADVPAMAWRGGESVTQTVDLNPNSPSGSRLDVEMG